MRLHFQLNEYVQLVLLCLTSDTENIVKVQQEKHLSFQIYEDIKMWLEGNIVLYSPFGNETGMRMQLLNNGKLKKW